MNVGATVLSSLFDVLQDQSVQMLQVINPYRPYTDTLEGCLKIRKRLRYAARMTVTGSGGKRQFD